MLHKPLSAIAALSLVAAPVALHAAPRAASPVAESEELAGAATLPLIAAILAVVVGAVIIAVDDDEDDAPVSP